MYCEKCGAKLLDGAKFCVKCGAPVNTATDITQQEQQPVQQPANQQVNQAVNQQINQQANQPMHPVPPMKNSHKKVIGIVAALAVIAIAVIYVVTNMKPTVSLDQYIKVTFDGYDTYGNAYVSFDHDKFIKDYGDQIEYDDKNSESEYMSYFYDSAAEALYDEVYSGDLDRTTDLSNNDVVTFTWDIDKESLEKSFKCKLKYSDVEVKVSGLQEIEVFNPFDGIDVSVEGVAPNGYAEVVNNSTDPMYGDFYYSIDRSWDLSNGDEVTITVSPYWGDDLEEYCIRYYGKKPSQTEKTITIEGLDTYISSIDEIPASLLTQMREQAEAEFTEEVEYDWSDYEVMNEMEYIGCYLLTPKDDTDYYNYNNILYLVYRIHGSDDYEDEEINSDFTYYYSTAFYDLTKDKDGNGSVDLTYYRTTSHYFSRYVQYGEGYWDYDTYWYYGYETLEELYESEIVYNESSYSCETNINE